MMFDFERPTQRDFTETIKTLAGLSRFIIADITNPKSSPLELGKPLKEIRTYVDQTYSRYGPPTPTPPVPQNWSKKG